MTTKFFWLSMAALFVTLAVKSYFMVDEIVMWVAVACAACSSLRALTGKSEKVTIQKLVSLVLPPK